VTIAAAFLTGEGVVLGADSTTTFTLPGPPGTSPSYKFYNSAQKLFQVGPDGNSRFAVCVWGDGRLGKFTHRAVAARLASKVTDSTTVDGLSNELVSIMKEPDAETGRAFAGYIIGGIDGVSMEPKCNRVMVEAGQAPTIVPLAQEDAIFVGAPRFFSRLHTGYDTELPALVAKRLAPLVGTPPPNFDELVKKAVEEASGELPKYVLAGIPIREAIDFVHMYLQLTIKAHKFLAGPTICGGAIELGVATVDRPFRWVRHKTFDSGIDGVL
jgi:hypothetical protein